MKTINKAIIQLIFLLIIPWLIVTGQAQTKFSVKNTELTEFNHLLNDADLAFIFPKGFKVIPGYITENYLLSNVILLLCLLRLSMLSFTICSRNRRNFLLSLQGNNFVYS